MRHLPVSAEKENKRLNTSPERKTRGKTSFRAPNQGGEQLRAAGAEARICSAASIYIYIYIHICSTSNSNSSITAPARVCGSSGALSGSAIPEELVTKGQGIILYETETFAMANSEFETQRLE